MILEQDRKIHIIDKTFLVPDYESVKIKVAEYGAQYASADNNYYRDTRRASRIKHNILDGKAAEFGVALRIHSVGGPYLEPDCLIYLPGEKSWQADLPYRDLGHQLPNIHVKVCTAWTANLCANRCKGSWTFQFSNLNGSGGRDKLFDNPISTDLIAFSYLDNWESETHTIFAVAPWNLIHDHLEDPILEKYRGLKKVMYSDTLIKLAA